MTAINPKIIKWFVGRGISADTVIRLGIYSGSRLGEDVVADESGSEIVYPFIEHDVAVAEKYRAAGKKFSQKTGGKRTFFNGDILDDPLLASGAQALVITEGEMDTCAAVEAGHSWAVSVPDGAPMGVDKDGKPIVVPETTEGIDPETDTAFKYIFNNWERLKPIKRIIIAADNDPPGVRLAAELVRRLGRVRCSFVTYPPGCKDLNDVLMRLGADQVLWTIAQAKPYPVSGVYKLSEFPAEAEFQTVSTGWPTLDYNLKLYYPACMVVTGRAGGGKSTWVNQLVAQIAYSEGWNIAIASFEMRVRPYVTDTLMRVRLRRPKYQWSDEDIALATQWVEDRFTFIAPDPDDDAVHDVAWLIERIETAVIRYGIRATVIDPWNEIEHARRRDESGTEYAGRAIKDLKACARRLSILIIIVAHPTKEGASKKPDEVSLYDIDGSAHFANKADLGVVIARIGETEHDTLMAALIKKVRYQPDCGVAGRVELNFNPQTRLFDS